MARQVSYTFKGQKKVIAFSYDRFVDLYEAVAAAEGIDLTAFLAMEQQLHHTAKDKAAVKNFRSQSFSKMGFADIAFVRENP
ncbi:DUF2960 domain-containing protein [Alishewanella sp. 16-MA]|uniref:DUF2960 domain-containing protein n=1 Tax=Alishewanella maricola TaxID=2795740 RepID=A0ABS8C627_9ALTE|nr:MULTISPECIES: DUF2960 domain-containing protein [Gammaproteobacteria]MDP4946090.1 DUF2960 domain-containing protein [Alishewanella sp.]MCB5227580.1 DUF2960 domain-containing protein [Alishewanella maricola]MCC5451696.1 DUF2960 domain-containing protein [Rheinheimera sp. UJ51]MCF4009697.1 DUF2960 domain-containing protein [Rheinheimera sp. UJ63]MDP5035618.1 DUF2960 domain-containing protein [Alishewanella sp.]